MGSSDSLYVLLKRVFSYFPVIDIDENYALVQHDEKYAADYFEFYNQPEVKKYLPDSLIPHTLDHAKEEMRYLRNIFTKKECVYWAIIDKKQDKLIGGCGFHQWSIMHGRIEIAYDLSTEYWRRGIMKNAIKLCLQFAFSQMAVTRVQATLVPENIPSINLLEKTHFTNEGTLKKYKFFKGAFTDVVMMSLVYEDYLSFYHGK